MALLDGPMLGFGCMRMPVRDGDQTDFDYEAICALFDRFLERGFAYFDTAYTYHGYKAEEAVRKALVERHPRDAFRLATKLPLRDFEDADDMERIFAEQLSACGVDRFDCYVLHNMGSNVYAKCEAHDAFGFVRRKKEEGRADYVGMSFHDTPELLDEILEKHGECLDFVQLQVNYLDWEQPSVQSRRCLEVAAAHGKPVIAMEPCKGGTLANVPDAAARILREADPGASPARWAMRFAASQPGVFLVLSGMNAMEQVDDNCETFESFRPISEAERAILDRVRAAIEASQAIACTACEYCTHGCPEKIPIPRYFALYNSAERQTGSFSSHNVYYHNMVQAGAAPASACIECGACERACPQHLPIRDLLKKVAGRLEASGFPRRE